MKFFVIWHDVSAITSIIIIHNENTMEPCDEFFAEETTAEAIADSIKRNPDVIVKDKTHGAWRS